MILNGDQSTKAYFRKIESPFSPYQERPKLGKFDFAKVQGFSSLYTDLTS